MHNLGAVIHVPLSLVFFTFPTVIQTMGVHMTAERIISVKLPSGQLEELSLSDSSVSVTSSNGLVIYRPRYQDLHHSPDLGALFFNIKGIFPCINSTSYNPTCGILTYEEDGFFQGRSFIQAADGGNDFRIFSSTENIKTYGFGIQGCAEFNTTCFPTYASFTVFCLLPREQCG